MWNNICIYWCAQGLAEVSKHIFVIRTRNKSFFPTYWSLHRTFFDHRLNLSSFFHEFLSLMQTKVTSSLPLPVTCRLSPGTVLLYILYSLQIGVLQLLLSIQAIKLSFWRVYYSGSFLPHTVITFDQYREEIIRNCYIWTGRYRRDIKNNPDLLKESHTS